MRHIAGQDFIFLHFHIAYLSKENTC